MNSESAISCFEDIPQHYLICVTVHRAKDLTTLNADTFVSIRIDDKNVETTATVKKSDSPYFNEYFVFELLCCQRKLLRQQVCLSLMRKICCGKDDVLGEAVIDFNTIWWMESMQNTVVFLI